MNPDLAAICDHQQGTTLSCAKHVHQFGCLAVSRKESLDDIANLITSSISSQKSAHYHMQPFPSIYFNRYFGVCVNPWAIGCRFEPFITLIVNVAASKADLVYPIQIRSWIVGQPVLLVKKSPETKLNLSGFMGKGFMTLLLKKHQTL